MNNKYEPHCYENMVHNHNLKNYSTDELIEELSNRLNSIDSLSNLIDNSKEIEINIRIKSKDSINSHAEEYDWCRNNNTLMKDAIEHKKNLCSVNLKKILDNYF